jgi:hypothetical protein
MPYPATVIEIMLASPGDVKDERVIVRKVIHQWNAENSRREKVALLPMGWETHAGSDVSGQRAQAHINDHLVQYADIMIGIFWTRLGTPTGRYGSGSAEEIKLHHKQRKPLMLYFSNTVTPPDTLDSKQYQEVRKLKEWAKGEGLIGTYSGLQEFTELFRKDLALILNQDDRLRARVAPAQDVDRPRSQLLSADAKYLLSMIAKDPEGKLRLYNKSGLARYSGSSGTLLDVSDTISHLRWRAALDELLAKGLLEDKTGRDELFVLAPKAIAATES